MEGAPSAPSTPKSFKLLSPLSTSSTDTTPLSGDDCAVYDSDQASHLSLNDSKARKKLAPRRKDAGTSTPKRTKRRKSNRSDMSTLGSGYSSVSAAGKIFRNLLILEESLREQVVEQRALRRKYLTFLAVLCSLMASLSHHLYFTDAENAAKGTTRAILQLILVALLVTLMLYHLSGEYQKTIVLPRKFMSSTNKGLRQLNVRLMKIKTPWSDQVPDLLREIFLTFITYVLKVFHTISPSSAENRNSKIEVFLVSCQAQCQPRIGVTGVKLVLNSRVFNTDIREGWEIYRNEFWINEGMRRRKRLLEFTEKKKRQPQGKEKEKDS
ncbi:sporulation-specific protein Spo7p [Diutina catenulata]